MSSFVRASRVQPSSITLNTVYHSMVREDKEWHRSGKFGQTLRALEFWKRATGIYLSYKATQARANVMRLSGRNEDAISEEIWKPHNEATGQRLYDLCVDLRGFYLKGGQFLGTRTDFIPEEICTQLSRLHDQVPPMPREEVENLLKTELAVDDLSDIFADIDLDTPLGSASIAQVHKGRLKSVRRPRFSRWNVFRKRHRPYLLEKGESAWDVCHKFGVGYRDLRRVNRGVDVHRLEMEEGIRVPCPRPVVGNEGNEGDVGSSRSAAEQTMLRRNGLSDGWVAVKVQYPDALEIMKQDLTNIRSWARFLSKTEIQFDLVSAVDELRKQIELEFDFRREARVMDEIALSLKPISRRVTVPYSVPGLVTERMLIMSFMEGIPLRQLSEKTKEYSPRKQRKAKERILKRLCEAYGAMIFGDGLFQADGHPGNILIQRGGRIALLDYGQSKKLTNEEIHSLGRLILAISKDDHSAISHALDEMGIEIEQADLAMKRRMAVGMFDTKGTVNPFDKDSPLKQSPISTFPSDFFFVLRVVQLIRGIKQGMQVDVNFSSADLWRHRAKEAVKRTRKSER